MSFCILLSLFLVAVTFVHGLDLERYTSRRQSNDRDQHQNEQGLRQSLFSSFKNKPMQEGFWNPLKDYYKSPQSMFSEHVINPQDLPRFLEPEGDLEEKSDEDEDENEDTDYIEYEAEGGAPLHVPATKTIPPHSSKDELHDDIVEICLTDLSGNPLPGEVEAGRCKFASHSKSLRARYPLKPVTPDASNSVVTSGHDESEKMKVHDAGRMWSKKMRKILKHYYKLLVRVEASAAELEAEQKKHIQKGDKEKFSGSSVLEISSGDDTSDHFSQTLRVLKKKRSRLVELIKQLNKKVKERELN